MGWCPRITAKQRVSSRGSVHARHGLPGKSGLQYRQAGEKGGHASSRATNAGTLARGILGLSGLMRQMGTVGLGCLGMGHRRAQSRGGPSTVLRSTAVRLAGCSGCGHRRRRRRSCAILQHGCGSREVEAGMVGEGTTPPWRLSCNVTAAAARGGQRPTTHTCKADWLLGCQHN